MATASGSSSTTEDHTVSLFTIELRIVLLGKVGAGKSTVARILLARKQAKDEIGSCIIREGEAAGRRICLVEAPGWDQCAKNTSERIKSNIIRSPTLCSPGPHALIIVLRVESQTPVPSMNELKSVSRHMELLSQRVWRHTMVLFLCDKEVGDLPIQEHIDKAKKLLDKCGNRHYILRSESQVPEFLEKIQEMVEENCGDFFLPQVYYDYMQSQIPPDISEMKKMYEDREERLKRDYQARILKIKESNTQAEDAVPKQRRGSYSHGRPSMNEDEQTVDIGAIKSKYRDEMLTLVRYYLKPAAVIALAIIGALVGSVVGSAHGVTGSGIGIVIGIAVTIPLSLWMIDAARVARDSSNRLQETKQKM